MRIKIPACEVEFEETGNTIWVHSPTGGTILRIKSVKGFEVVHTDCKNVCSHSDIIVEDRILICLSDDVVNE